MDESDYKLVSCGTHLLVSNGNKTFEFAGEKLNDIHIPSDSIYPFDQNFIVQSNNDYILYNSNL